MWQSLKPRSTIIITTSSRAIDSAQPMSLPREFHPATSFQAAQWSAMITPMPQPVDASIQMFGSTMRHGVSEWGTQGIAKIACHQYRSSNISLGMWWPMKSFGNLERNEEREGRKAWPSQYTKVMCWSVPWMDRNSLQVTYH